MKLSILTGLALIAATAATPAQAGELFGGLYVHGVNTPLSLGGSPEGGVDLQLGYRGGPILGGLKLEPYAFGAVNTSGDTNYAAVGLSRKFGDRIYIRPGIGLAVHTGSAAEPRQSVQRQDRIRQPDPVRARAWNRCPAERADERRGELGAYEPRDIVQRPEPRHRQYRRPAELPLLAPHRREIPARHRGRHRRHRAKGRAGSCAGEGLMSVEHAGKRGRYQPAIVAIDIAAAAEAPQALPRAAASAWHRAAD